MIHTRSTSIRRRVRGVVLGAATLALAGVSLPAAAGGGPSLGVARSFGALGASTVTNTGATTVVTGDVGVSPGSAVVGFGPGQVTGGTYVGGDTKADQAHGDAALAYAYLKGMASIPANNLSDTDLGGRTLAPGVWKFNVAAGLTGALVLDAGGDSGAVFVFQIGSSLTTASGASVTVINGGADYDESNVFWQVGSSATLGSGTAFTGNILAYASISLNTGATMTGNALALVGAVTLDSNAVTSPTASAAPIPVPGAPAVPVDVAAAPTGVTADRGSDVRWTDMSTNETEFRVFRRDGASPDFVLIGTVASTDTPGTGQVSAFRDTLLDPSSTHSYRVVAFSAAGGASVPSGEARVDAFVVPVGGDPGASRWVNLHLGRGKSAMRDVVKSHGDSVLVNGSFSVILVENGFPTVLNELDPRAAAVTIQIRAPGSVLFVSIPANDPRWKASKNGVYTWKTRDARTAPISSMRIDARKSEFTFKSDHAEFSSLPANSITVSFACQGASGSETRAWDVPKRLARGVRAQFSLPR